MKLLKHNEGNWIIYKSWLFAIGVRPHGDAPECLHIGLDDDTHIASASLFTAPGIPYVHLDRMAFRPMVADELQLEAFRFMLRAVRDYCDTLGKEPYLHGPEPDNHGVVPITQALQDCGWKPVSVAWSGADAKSADSDERELDVR